MIGSVFGRISILPGLSFALGVAAVSGGPGPVPPELLAGLRWRNVGPLRGGRIAAVSGVIGQAGVFYVGLPAGGVWKTTSAGETWFPVFDSITAVSSVGSIAVAPSDPNVIYLGTGDLITGNAINEGNGIYKSTDAGRTWHHLGLDDTKQVPSILVDPRDPNLVLLAAQGNVHQKSEARGVFRSTDGGRSWTRTLFVDDSTGAQKITWAADHPETMLATTVAHYIAPHRPPTRTRDRGTGPTDTRLYKSTDEGLTWHELAGSGLPRLTGRTSVAVAMTTNAERMYLIGDFGLYRSDDGGVTWRQMAADDSRIANGQGGYNCGVYVDPQNPDIVYTINTSSYKSIDGGQTFTGFKGAPGGDDPQQMWIDPTNGQRILLGLDQGAVVTFDGGGTWSSWYNQSTEQVYHIAADNSFPYWIYASQQDAGAVRVRVRGNLGAVTPLDWTPVNGWEWGSELPDPLNPNIVYATGSGIVKMSFPSEQWIDVSPALDPALKARTSLSQPLAFAPWNPRELLAGLQYLVATTDAGAHWTKLSPDLGYAKGVTPPPDSLRGRPGQPVAGAIEALSASTLARGEIWVGTTNGLVELTRDEGKTWTYVSIPNLPDSTRADISSIDASHFNAGEAYVAVDLHRVGNYAPFLYRTQDFGKTWTLIVAGLPTDQPSGSFARVVRGDTERAGLLFAGTESGVYVSFDDGDHWQSLMLNLPNTSYRDLVIKGNDLIVGTYGRGIYVLDDFSPLRQITAGTAAEPVHFFAPGDAVRVRRNVGADTPFPPEVPHTLNPPDGALIYYFLAAKPSSDITLEVLDSAGAVVRRLSGAPIAPVAEAARPPEPNFWLATPEPLPTAVGTNRVNWDVRYDDPPALTHTFEINANPGLTPPSPVGPLALPGTYTLRLTIDGKRYTQSLRVRNDPRSPATLADLRAQHVLQMAVYRGLQASWDRYHQVAALRAAVAADTAAGDVAQAAKGFDSTLAAVAGDPDDGAGSDGTGRRRAPTFASVNAGFVGQLNGVENGDLAATEAMWRGYSAGCTDLMVADSAWAKAKTAGLVAFNAILAGHGVPSVPAVPPAAPLTCPKQPSRVARSH